MPFFRIRFRVCILINRVITMSKPPCLFIVDCCLKITRSFRIQAWHNRSKRITNPTVSKEIRFFIKPDSIGSNDWNDIVQSPGPNTKLPVLNPGSFPVRWNYQKISMLKYQYSGHFGEKGIITHHHPNCPDLCFEHRIRFPRCEITLFSIKKVNLLISTHNLSLIVN